MQSFRTELENSIVEKDIIELERKIRLYREGKIDDDKFRSLRLARGVYGQRQHGVQMIRIKLPYGKMTFQQWLRICDVSDEYSTGNLHFTTRQDIQIHYVSLDRTPELWAKLEEDNVTLREACGNTVRNVTASVTSGIDPNEPFDVTPYAHSIFTYFLRNPICQEMGRKIKISFSNTDEDTALSYMHDMGFIPKLQNNQRGFKVLVGGGLGAQPKLADVAYDFLPEEQLIPFVEAVLRVFDRHGERNSRSKARLKFLIAKIGFDEFMELVNEEKLALKNKIYSIESIETIDNEEVILLNSLEINEADVSNYQRWEATNVVAQKQENLFGIYVRVPLGNISTAVSRQLINELKGYVADDIRVTINQGFFLRNVPKENLAYVFSVLKKYNLAEPSANGLHKITACPGTDTCNLGIADSTNITLVFEQVLREEFPDLIYDNDIKIKISGCMNSCGQHGMAQIGFHGSSLKAKDKRVMPALQVLLGGGTLGNGEGRVAEKVIKVPSKRGPNVLRWVLADYDTNAQEGEYFNNYFDRQGKNYFYELLKPLADLDTVIDSDFVDWGHTEQFSTAIGVGECAGVMIDLVATLLLESKEKIQAAKDAFNEQKWADAIYHAYAAQVNTAKALLLDRDVNCSTQHKVISEIDVAYPTEFGGNIQAQILEIRANEPSAEFAAAYLKKAEDFVEKALLFRGVTVA
jgi:sulfite reductase (ferredoxin)